MHGRSGAHSLLDRLYSHRHTAGIWGHEWEFKVARIKWKKKKRWERRKEGITALRVAFTKIYKGGKADLLKE